jgi:hypothetical protein
VDGIYPELARFVKTMSKPLTDHHKNMQNGKRHQEILSAHLESIKGNLIFFVNDMEQWYVSDITEAVATCIILHNMMVQ